MTPLSASVGGELKAYNLYLWKKTNRSLSNILIEAVFLGKDISSLMLIGHIELLIFLVDCYQKLVIFPENTASHC